MLKEFKEFAMRGNVVDLAVGIVIGVAFGKIVTSFVNDVLMPPVGLALGGTDFSNFKTTLKDAQGEVPAVTLNYGMFLQSVIDFTIIAFAIFLLVKAVNSFRKKEPVAPAEPPADVKLLTEIRDLLQKNKPEPMF